MIREDVTPVIPQGPEVVAAVTLTAAAAAHLEVVRAEKGLAPTAGLRVFVKGGGCSGLQYGMMFETEPAADDLVFDSAGVRVVVDPVSITYLQGATIDYVEGPMGGGFHIDNPNASCGCESAAGTAGCGGCGSH